MMMKKTTILMIGILISGLLLMAPLQSAKAQACCNCPEEVSQESARQWDTGSTAGDPSSWPTVDRLENHATSELSAHRVWMISVFWEDNVLPALMLMSEQLTAVALKQA